MMNCNDPLNEEICLIQFINQAAGEKPFAFGLWK